CYVGLQQEQRLIDRRDQSQVLGFVEETRYRRPAVGSQRHRIAIDIKVDMLEHDGFFHLLGMRSDKVYSRAGISQGEFNAFAQEPIEFDFDRFGEASLHDNPTQGYGTAGSLFPVVTEIDDFVQALFAVSKAVFMND